VIFLSSNNAVLIDNCKSLQNLTVRLEVTEDLIPLGNAGFSLQLNTYPQLGNECQGQTLNWFQYAIVIQAAGAFWGIEYWALGSHEWPPGYTPNPNTTPSQPVVLNLPPDSLFGFLPSNQLPAGSVIEITLSTDSSANVTNATFIINMPDGYTSSGFITFPEGALYPICGFQVNLVGPGGGSPCTFTSGAGVLTYSVSPGTLSVQDGPVGAACGEYSGAITGETSNAVYGDVTPSAGSTVSQTLTITTTMKMEFKLEKATFGQDEVAQTPQWGSAYWLAVSGFPNVALGFNSPSDLNAQPNLLPTVTPSINALLNNGLTPTQLATIAQNLPDVKAFGPPPVLAIDDTLSLDYQTFMYPFTISFPNENAFRALDAHQIAIVTLTAQFTVQVPTGIDANNNITTTPVSVGCQANIELAKGEDPYLFNFNPNNPEAYPSWLSYDLRLFKVTPNQKHLMFSVPNPTDASNACDYIKQVLNHLNNPNLIKNGDTFDNTLTQDEEWSAIEFTPTDDSGDLTFNFAVARVRITSSINTTIGPVRVFFRLFNAASTVTDFSEVGTNEGTYRWGTDGSPGHKIPLLGVWNSPESGYEYVTVPCFATPRVNLTQPADMKTQHDPPNAVMITTMPGQDVDTYFGCWLDVNQSTPFLIPMPPLPQSQWDGPWTGTESLNGVIAVAPHQCLVAEIRFDDTPIPNGATPSTSDKLAQRNIAWLKGPPG
jgi:hypothetical protein